MLIMSLKIASSPAPQSLGGRPADRRRRHVDGFRREPFWGRRAPEDQRSCCSTCHRQALEARIGGRCPDLPATARAPRVLVGVCGPDWNVVLVGGIRLNGRVANVDDGRGIGIVGIGRVLLADPWGNRALIKRLAGAHGALPLYGCLNSGYPRTPWPPSPPRAPNSRTSPTSRSDTLWAAKWPPWSNTDQWTMFLWSRSANRRMPLKSPQNAARPIGIVVDSGGGVACAFS